MKIIAILSFYLALLPAMNIYGEEPIYIKGKVIDAETGAPVENALLRIPGIGKVQMTDSEGRFTFTLKSHGNYKVEISRMGYQRFIKQCHIEECALLEPVIRLEPMGITTAAVVVTGTKGSSKFIELSEEIGTKEGRQLQNDLGQTIASTLKNETSIAVRSLGPAPARPVIRGLGGSRIIIAEDGMATSDLSGTSADHAVTIEPFSASKIEVIRGPRTVLYTGSLAGGAINVVNDIVPIDIPSIPTATAGAFYESANNGFLGNISAELPIGAFGFKGILNYKKGGNISSPDGELANTGIDNMNYHFGAGWSETDFAAGAALHQFNSEYGIPGGFLGGHPKGADIEMLKRNILINVRYHMHKPALDNVELRFQRSYYHHTEYESNGSVGSEFVVRDISARLLFNQKKNSIGDGELLGSYGLFFEYKDFDIGGFVFTPPTRAVSIAPFVFEDFSIQSWNFQVGIRYGYDKYFPEILPTTRNPEIIRDRDFHSLAASLAAMKNLFSNIHAGFNLYRTVRPPTIEELYNEGPHLAAYSYEIGNPQLEKEEGLGAELFAYYKDNKTFAMVTGFYNRMSSFIVPRNTGDTNYTILLPIYKTYGLSADLYGFEASVRRYLERFRFEGSVGYVVGEMTESGDYLPMIPPLKGSLEVSYRGTHFFAGARADFAAAQNKTDQFEEATDGYFIFGLFSGLSFGSGNLLHRITVNVENLTNTIYRNHLSRIKSIMPEPGLNLRIIYKVFYQ